MEPDTSEDHLLIDLGPEDQWVNPEITNAVNALQEALYSAGCNVNNMKITVPSLPGINANIETDYGKISIVAEEVA